MSRIFTEVMGGSVKFLVLSCLSVTYARSAFTWFFIINFFQPCRWLMKAQTPESGSELWAEDPLEQWSFPPLRMVLFLPSLTFHTHWDSLNLANIHHRLRTGFGLVPSLSYKTARQPGKRSRKLYSENSTLPGKTYWQWLSTVKPEHSSIEFTKNGV